MRDALHVTARWTPRRRSVPTRPKVPVPRSLHQRWRERPRCRARRLTSERSDGVVHAIAGRGRCPCLRARAVQENRAARVSRSVRGRGPIPPAEVSSHTNAVLPQNMTTIRVLLEPHHHRVDDAGAVLGVVNALRFAPTRPVAGPSGIDDASARHGSATTRWWRDLMRRTTRTTRLTTTARGRMLTAFRQCRRALLRCATLASGARIPPIAQRARFGAHPLTTSQPRCRTAQSGDLHTVGCDLTTSCGVAFSGPRAAPRQRSTGRVIAPRFSERSKTAA